MTSGQAEPDKDHHQRARDNEDAVAGYLLQHTDFLVHHPEVLAKVHIPHGAGGAISLIERQVAVLREQLGIERGRLNHLMARARDYDRLSKALHKLTVQLIVARDMTQARHVLTTVLSEKFNADAVALKLFPVEPDLRASDPLVGAFIDFIDRDRCLCGPLHPSQGEPLFGNQAPTIHSAALIPITGHDQTGVLAIGSCDAKRFTPDRSTELLERLGAIVSAKLQDLAHRGL
jgi:uncharacterized protein YigA (DUF484 family)